MRVYEDKETCGPVYTCNRRRDLCAGCTEQSVYGYICRVCIVNHLELTCYVAFLRLIRESQPQRLLLGSSTDIYLKRACLCSSLSPGCLSKALGMVSFSSVKAACCPAWTTPGLESTSPPFRKALCCLSAGMYSISRSRITYRD